MGEPCSLLLEILPIVCLYTIPFQPGPSLPLPLPQPHLLKRHRMLDVYVGLNVLGRQPLQLGMELSHPVLGQQEEEVEAQELVHIGRFWELLPVAGWVNQGKEGLDIYHASHSRHQGS